MSTASTTIWLDLRAAIVWSFSRSWKITAFTCFETTSAKRREQELLYPVRASVV